MVGQREFQNSNAIESLLFKNASTFAEYMDMSTFSQRIDTAMTDFINQTNTNSTTERAIDQLSQSLEEKL